YPLKCRGQIFFAGRFRFQGKITLPLEVLKRSIDANLISELYVLSPEQAVGTAKFRYPAKRVRIQSGIGRYSQIVQDLVDAVGGDRPQRGRLAHVCPQHLGEGGAKPVERRIARGIAEGQD